MLEGVSINFLYYRGYSNIEWELIIAFTVFHGHPVITNRLRRSVIIFNDGLKPITGDIGILWSSRYSWILSKSDGCKRLSTLSDAYSKLAKVGAIFLKATQEGRFCDVRNWRKYEYLILEARKMMMCKPTFLDHMITRSFQQFIVDLSFYSFLLLAVVSRSFPRW